MTSKISSAKLLKESVKRNGAFAILLLLLFFCYFPIGGMILLQDNLGWQGTVRVLYVYGTANPFLFAATFGCAFLLGIMQFFYLHSREKLDFYHSLPVRRERYFLVQYAGGIFLWLVPFVINTLLYLLVCAAHSSILESGVMGALSALLVKGLFAHTACFLLTYSLAVLVMMVTGKIFAAVVGFGVLCAYVPAVKMLQEVMMEFYFSTYCSPADIGKSIGIKCTPVYAYMRVCADMMNEKFPADILIALVLIAVLCGALGLYLYRKRGSENAGKPMVFAGIARVIKFLLVVPITLICAVFMYAITGNNMLWGLFGCLFGLLLCSGVIEFVYRMDIREALCDKKQLALSAAVTLAVLAVFRFDLFGYDRWLPEQEEIESVDIRSSYPIVPNYVSEYEKAVDADGEVFYVRQRVHSYEPEYNMKAVDEIYDFIKHSTEYENGSITETADYWNQYWSKVVITYHMKDGTSKIRSYSYNESMLKEWFAPIWETEEYKEAVYPVLRVSPEDICAVRVAPDEGYFGSVISAEEEAHTAKDEDTSENAGSDVGYVTDAESGMEYADDYVEDRGSEVALEKPLTREQIEKIAEVFQKELRSRKLEQMYLDAEYDILLLYREEDGGIYSQQFSLGAGFEETMKLLKEYGFSININE